MPARPRVSVIIPSFRALDCLRLSLLEFLKLRDCEVVVGLDGDSVAYRSHLKELPVTLSVTQRRQGACTATNLAAARAGGEYLLFCNDDMVPSPGAVEALLESARPDRIVSGWCWEPGAVPAPPPFAVRDFGRDPGSFKKAGFFAAASKADRNTETGVNYPFLIHRGTWERVGGLDERFDPGSASDPDLFIRLAMLDPAPGMVREKGAVFYHFASRSSIFAGGRLSLSWKLHRRHGRMMFRRKWGRMWAHRFGEVPETTEWRRLLPRPEPKISGKLWRHAWFGANVRHEVIRYPEGGITAFARIRRGLSSEKSVTIFIWGGLGNMAMALPMVNALRKTLDPEQVSLALQRPEMAQLITGRERYNTILLTNSITRENFLPSLMALRTGVSLSALPYPRWRYGLSAVLCGARVRAGDRALPNALLNKLVDTKAEGLHLVERNLAMLAALGIDCRETVFDIPISSEDRISAGVFLDKSGLRKTDTLLGLHPGAGNPMRRWPAGKYIELGTKLVGLGKSVVVLGGPGEEALAAEVARGIGSGAVPFTGKLGPALALLKMCRALAAADSGLAHCAAALGVPVLAVMGPSDEAVYRPYGPKVKVITGRPGCRPCYRPGGRVRCGRGNRPCLDIPAGRVLEGLQEWL